MIATSLSKNVSGSNTNARVPSRHGLRSSHSRAVSTSWAVAPHREPRLGQRGPRHVAAKFFQAVAILAVESRRGVQREPLGLVAERVRSGDRHMRGCRSGGVIAQRLDRAARLGAERDA